MRPLRFAGLLLAVSTVAQARDWVVCPAGLPARASCDLRGDGGPQQAIDRAADGDTIHLRAGHYVPRVARDTPFADIVVRAWLTVRDKRLAIVGEPGVVFDGRSGLAATAMLIERSDVRLGGLRLTGFHWAVEEDAIYDGHGIFVIDGRVRIDDVAMDDIAKMAIVGRGDSEIDISRFRLTHGHVGLWLHERAHARVRDALFRDNDTSAVAAYDDSIVQISASLVEGTRDDGLYTEQHAIILATNSILIDNGPAAVHAAGGSIRLGHDAFWHNRRDTLADQGGEIVYGEGMVTADPRLGADGRPAAGSPLIGAGDPLLARPIGSGSTIGPGGARATW